MDLKVSVIIPTFKRNDYLVQAIDSVILQVDVNLELIVIDDDPLSLIEKSLSRKYGDSVKYKKNKKNLGPGESRKNGFLMATGDLVVFMDDDDYYTDNLFLSKAVERFKNNNGLSFVGFASTNFSQSQNKIISVNKFYKVGVINNKKYLMNFGKIKKPTSTFTTVFCKDKLIKANVTDVNMFNDSIIYLRALLSADAFLDNTVIGNYRIHKKNITKGLSEKFIVENLIEKENISKLLPFKKYNRSIWLYKQAWQTIIYFMVNSGSKGNCLIMNWVNRQTILSRILLLIRIMSYRLTLKVRG